MDAPKTVYLAGPMTGLHAYNFPAFDEAAQRWRAAGWQVISPADITRAEWKEQTGKDFNPEQDKCEWGSPYMATIAARDIEAAIRADAIALLPGWEKSRGTSPDLFVALQHGKDVYDAQTFERLPMGARLTFVDNEQENARTARAWSAILGTDIDTHTCALMLECAHLIAERQGAK